MNDTVCVWADRLSCWMSAHAADALPLGLAEQALRRTAESQQDRQGWVVEWPASHLLQSLAWQLVALSSQCSPERVALGRSKRLNVPKQGEGWTRDR